MAQGFGLENIKKIAHRTVQKDKFMDFAKDASQVLSGKKVPERASRDTQNISKDEGR